MKLKLIDKKQETADVYSFVFKTGEPFTWKAGQFMMYELEHPDPDERGSRRFFTIASAPFEKDIRLTTRLAKEGGSSFKNALFNLPIGSTIYGDGPRGIFVLEDPNKEYVFIAGGIGITPFHSILFDLDHRRHPINVVLLYASNTPDTVYKKELDQLAKKHSGLKIHYIVAPDLIDEVAIKKFVPDLVKPLFYISGPEPMVKSLENLLSEIGVSKENIKRDYFPGYSRL